MEGTMSDSLFPLHRPVEFCNRMSCPFRKSTYWGENAVHGCELLECTYGPSPVVSSEKSASTVNSRRIRIYDNVREVVDGKGVWKRVLIGEGTFIMYGLNTEVGETSVASFTSVIVEMDDGTIQNVCTSLAEFVKEKPSE